MAKFSIFIAFFVSFVMMNAANRFYETDDIDHIYEIGIEIGQMNYDQVGPMIFRLSPMTEKGGPTAIVLNEKMIFASNSNYNFTITTDIPLEQIALLDFEWQDSSQMYGRVKDVNILIAYVTEVTPNLPKITKKYCNHALQPYPINWAGMLALRIIRVC